MLQAVMNGQQVSRPCWPEGEYVVHLPGMPYLWKIMTLPNPNAGNWIPTLDDLMASDYVLLKDVPAKVVEEIKE